MALENFSTDDLRAELERRDVAKREEEASQLRAQFPCPECGGDPSKISTNAVREHRQAPRDDDGRPIIFAPYEMGETVGIEYERTLICVNGHETVTTETQWLAEPRKGPPLVL